MNTESDKQKRREKYLADPTRCPYCDCTNIAVTDSGLNEDMGPLDRDERLVECGECHNEWRETVKKVVVEIDFGDELDPLSLDDKAKREAEDAAREELETEYLDKEGNFCPHCKSRKIRYIERSVWNHESKQYHKTVSCDDCSHAWHEIYKLAELSLGD